MATDDGELPPEMREYLRKIGRKGGEATTPAKSAASKANILAYHASQGKKPLSEETRAKKRAAQQARRAREKQEREQEQT